MYFPLIFLIRFQYLNIYGRIISPYEQFRPFDETDVFWIIKYFLTSDIHEIIVRLETIEIEMIDILSIFIIIYICRAFYRSLDSEK